MCARACARTCVFVCARTCVKCACACARACCMCLRARACCSHARTHVRTHVHTCCIHANVRSSAYVCVWLHVACICACSYLCRVSSGGDDFDQELWNVFEEEEHHEPLAKIDLFYGVVVDLGMSGAGIRLGIPGTRKKKVRDNVHTDRTGSDRFEPSPHTPQS